MGVAPHTLGVGGRRRRCAGARGPAHVDSAPALSNARVAGGPLRGDTAVMFVWLAVAGAFVAELVLANAVSVRRFSRRHIAGEVALRGRGLFFSRTPDGTWWSVRL